MIRTVMINASPKLVIRKSVPSASHALIQIAKKYLRRERIHDITDYHIKTGEMPKDDIKTLFTCEVWLISFPIYFGALPSHLMRFMDDIRLLSTSFLKPGTPSGLEHPIKVYAIANGGLYDGSEAQTAFEMLQYWCEECGFIWGSGLGVGGGPTFGVAHTVGDLFRLHSSFSRALTSFSQSVARQQSSGNFYCTPAIGKKHYVVRMNRLYKKMKKVQKNTVLD